MAMGATAPFARTSCGFVGASDGWTDLHDNFVMDWEFDTASDGNVALTGEVDLSTTKDFTLGVAFGATEHNAIATLMQSLSLPFDDHLATYKAQWETASAGMAELASHSYDGAASTEAAAVCCWPMRTKPTRGRSSHRSRSRGEKSRATTTRADTISSGRETWSAASWRWLLPETFTRRCARSSFSPSRSTTTADSRRTFG
jgi:hypothetical protein